ncbi:YihY/virulence factor BrkB family protein [Microbacterium sp. NPDC076895]|uniref:YihY/virulence factor BrkB family protein n=1 Tax=Microbacterium sp. NPDC076895 TaxID=3154957 RepID=UPI0034349FD7
MPAALKTFVAAVTRWALSLRIVRTMLLYGERRGPVLADSVTYRALFSIFAAALIGFWFAGRWLADNPEAWDALVEAVDTVIPGLIGEGGVISLDTLESGLTIAGVVGFVGLVLASLGAIGTLRAALHVLGGTVFDDGFFLWVQLRNLAMALGVGLALVVTAAVTYFGTAGVSIVAGWLGFSPGTVLVGVLTRAVVIVAVFILDAALIAAIFLVLGGIRPPARALWAGSLLGALGLTVLQQLSGLFVQGASSNPLLSASVSLIALLLWLNFSAQVILIACTYIVVAAEESQGVVPTAPPVTFAQRRLRRAQAGSRAATAELLEARAAAIAEAEDLGDYARGMAIARLHGGPLDGQVLPLESPDADTMIVPYGEGQVVYERRGALGHTGDHDGPTEGEFFFVESTEDIAPSDD